MESAERSEGVTLAAAEALLRVLPSPAAVIDAGGAVLQWNDAAAQVFGWSAAERVGRTYLAEQTDEAQAFAGRLARALAGETVRAPVTRTRRDGEALTLAATLSPLRDASGEISGALEVLAEDPAAAEARKLAVVGTIAGGLAHDFNNLLTVISGYSAVLQHALGGRPELHAMAREISEASQRAERLTRRLLVLSRRRVSQPRRLDLNAAIAATSALLGRVLGEAIELSLHLRPDLGDIQVDPAQLELVLLNLALNAREAMPEGGRVRVETDEVERAPACTHRGATAPAGRCVVLRVRDSGEGMDAATRARLFEPFFTTKAELGATGLGLATVFAAVREAGGGLRVESEPGRGASFEVYLPRVPGPPRAAESPAPASAEQTARERVLVVEDDPSVRRTAVDLLQRLGYAVEAVGSGDEALARADGPPDLLLTDVMMPGMTGWELAARLSAAHPAVKVLFMSGAAEAPRGRPRAPLHFLPKPFSLDALARKVREALDAG